MPEDMFRQALKRLAEKHPIKGYDSIHEWIEDQVAEVIHNGSWDNKRAKEQFVQLHNEMCVAPKFSTQL
jgi:hypothetical protein